MTTEGRAGEPEAPQATARPAAARDPGMIWVSTDPLFKDLRAEPRYRALLARLKLPSGA